MKKINRKITEFFKLFGVFFKIGSVTFGGGLAMLPILERELAEKRNWTTKDQLLDYYAIGQSTPGIIAVNVATFIGYNRAGILGGIFATIGIVTPSIIIISLLARFIKNFSDIVIVKKAMAGINVAVAALLTKAAWQFGKRSVKNIWGFLLLIAAFCSIYFFKLNSIILIIIAATLGITVHLLKNKATIKANSQALNSTNHSDKGEKQ